MQQLPCATITVSKAHMHMSGAAIGCENHAKWNIRICDGRVQQMLLHAVPMQVDTASTMPEVIKVPAVA